MTTHAISCDRVSVQYTSPTHASMSIKESAIRLLKGQSEQGRFFNALGDVSLAIGRGETVAFIGPNGCGKSTLLKVIAGVITPQKGAVQTNGIIAPLIELGAGFDQDLTGVENIWMSCRLMGASKELIREKLTEIVEFAELGDFIHAPVKTYSSGMYMRLGFACSTIINPEILLVDEILAVGDARFQRKCLDRIHKIQTEGKTIVIVSHDRATIQEICSRAVFLWRGRIVYDGAPEIAFQIYDRMQTDGHLHDQPEKVVEEVLRTSQLAFANVQSTEARLIRDFDVHSTLNEIDGRKLLEISCDFRITMPSDSPITIGFQIRQQSQGRIFGTNTKYMDDVTESQRVMLGKSGQVRVNWTYDCTILSSGTYLVDVCISDFEITQIYEFLAEADKFQIVNEKDTLNHDKNLVELDKVGFDVKIID